MLASCILILAPSGSPYFESITHMQFPLFCCYYYCKRNGQFISAPTVSIFLSRDTANAWPFVVCNIFIFLCLLNLNHFISETENVFVLFLNFDALHGNNSTDEFKRLWKGSVSIARHNALFNFSAVSQHLNPA